MAGGRGRRRSRRSSSGPAYDPEQISPSGVATPFPMMSKYIAPTPGWVRVSLALPDGLRGRRKRNSEDCEQRERRSFSSGNSLGWDPETLRPGLGTGSTQPREQVGEDRRSRRSSRPRAARPARPPRRRTPQPPRVRHGAPIRDARRGRSERGRLSRPGPGVARPRRVRRHRGQAEARARALATPDKTGASSGDSGWATTAPMSSVSAFHRTDLERASRGGGKRESARFLLPQKTGAAVPGGVRGETGNRINSESRIARACPRRVICRAGGGCDTMPVPEKWPSG